MSGSSNITTRLRNHPLSLEKEKKEKKEGKRKKTKILYEDMENIWVENNRSKYNKKNKKIIIELPFFKNTFDLQTTPKLIFTLNCPSLPFSPIFISFPPLDYMRSILRITFPWKSCDPCGDN